MRKFFGSGTNKRVTGKAADAGYTVAKAAQQQAANRQTVQDWWNTGQAKADRTTPPIKLIPPSSQEV